MEEKLNSRRKHIIKCQKSRQEKEKCWSDIINWNAFSFFYESKSLDSSPLQVSWFSIARTNWRHRRERQYKRREKRNKKKKYNLKLWFDDHHPPSLPPSPSSTFSLRCKYSTAHYRGEHRAETAQKTILNDTWGVGGGRRRRGALSVEL